MNQLRVIECLFHWLQAHRWSDSLTVKCDHVTEAREELALFLGSKVAGQGRGSRVAQVDILVCNNTSQTVDLIVEVDPNPNPKKLMGDILAVLLADNYTPSNGFSPYKFDKTLFIFLTILDGRSGSQKEPQFRLIENALRDKLDLGSLGIRDVRLCFGKDEEDAIRRAQAVVMGSFTEAGGCDATAAIANTGQAPPMPVRVAAPTARHDYSLQPNFDARELTRLLQIFRSAVKRKSDVSLARHLELELLERGNPMISRATVEQLARWCKTDGIYSDGMDIARQISQLLFGCILDRGVLGV